MLYETHRCPSASCSRCGSASAPACVCMYMSIISRMIVIQYKYNKIQDRKQILDVWIEDMQLSQDQLIKQNSMLRLYREVLTKQNQTRNEQKHRLQQQINRLVKQKYQVGVSTLTSAYMGVYVGDNNVGTYIADDPHMTLLQRIDKQKIQLSLKVSQIQNNISTCSQEVQKLRTQNQNMLNKIQNNEHMRDIKNSIRTNKQTLTSIGEQQQIEQQIIKLKNQNNILGTMLSNSQQIQTRLNALFNENIQLKNKYSKASLNNRISSISESNHDSDSIDSSTINVKIKTERELNQLKQQYTNKKKSQYAKQFRKHKDAEVGKIKEFYNKSVTAKEKIVDQLYSRLNQLNTLNSTVNNTNNSNTDGNHNNNEMNKQARQLRNSKIEVIHLQSKHMLQQRQLQTLRNKVRELQLQLKQKQITNTKYKRESIQINKYESLVSKKSQQISEIDQGIKLYQQRVHVLESKIKQLQKVQQQFKITEKCTQDKIRTLQENVKKQLQNRQQKHLAQIEQLQYKIIQQQSMFNVQFAEIKENNIDIAKENQLLKEKIQLIIAQGRQIIRKCFKAKEKQKKDKYLYTQGKSQKKDKSQRQDKSQRSVKFNRSNRDTTKKNRNQLKSNITNKSASISREKDGQRSKVKASSKEREILNPRHTQSYIPNKQQQMNNDKSLNYDKYSLSNFQSRHTSTKMNTDIDRYGQFMQDNRYINKIKYNFNDDHSKQYRKNKEQWRLKEEERPKYYQELCQHLSPYIYNQDNHSQVLIRNNTFKNKFRTNSNSSKSVSNQRSKSKSRSNTNSRDKSGSRGKSRSRQRSICTSKLSYEQIKQFNELKSKFNKVRQNFRYLDEEKFRNKDAEQNRDKYVHKKGYKKMKNDRNQSERQGQKLVTSIVEQVEYRDVSKYNSNINKNRKEDKSSNNYNSNNNDGYNKYNQDAQRASAQNINTGFYIHIKNNNNNNHTTRNKKLKPQRKTDRPKYSIQNQHMQSNLQFSQLSHTNQQQYQQQDYVPASKYKYRQIQTQRKDKPTDISASRQADSYGFKYRQIQTQRKPNRQTNQRYRERERQVFNGGNIQMRKDKNPLQRLQRRIDKLREENEQLRNCVFV